MVYCTVAMIRRVCPHLVANEFTDAELMEYAVDAEETIVKPILSKQYNLASLGNNATAQRLSAMAAALMATQSKYNSSPMQGNISRSLSGGLGPDLEALEKDVDELKRLILTGAVRL